MIWRSLAKMVGVLLARGAVVDILAGPLGVGAGVILVSRQQHLFNRLFIGLSQHQLGLAHTFGVSSQEWDCWCVTGLSLDRFSSCAPAATWRPRLAALSQRSDHLREARHERCRRSHRPQYCH